MTLEEKQKYDKLLESGLFFNPKTVYDGMYDLAGDMYDKEKVDGTYLFDINKDIFALNSKMIDGENAYAKFLDEKIYSMFNFYSTLSDPEYGKDEKEDLNKEEQERVDNFIKNRLGPTLSLRYDDKKKVRKLTFSHEFMFTKLLSVLQMGFEIKLGNYNQMRKMIKKHLNESTDALYKVLKNKNPKKSDYDYIKELYGVDVYQKNVFHYNSKLESEIEVMGRLNMVKKEYNDNMRKLGGIYEISKRFRQVFNTYNSKIKDVDVNELIEIIDIDKLYLIVAASLMEICLSNEGMVYAISEVRDYVYYIISNFGKDYNVSIKMYNDITKTVVDYDFLTLKKQVNDYMNKHPKAYNLLKEKDDTDTLFASWEFVKKGEIGPREDKVKVSRKTSKETEEKRREKYNKALIDATKRSEVLSNTDFLYKIIGINSFDGYEGYIYKDGTILLEHVYSDSKTKTPCLESGATYVMNIYNFIEFSKKTKPEIIEYISSTDNPEVKRKYHSKNWNINILKLIEGKQMNIDTLLIINNMINDGTLSKVKK